MKPVCNHVTVFFTKGVLTDMLRFQGSGEHSQRINGHRGADIKPLTAQNTLPIDVARQLDKIMNAVSFPRPIFAIWMEYLVNAVSAVFHSKLMLCRPVGLHLLRVPLSSLPIATMPLRKIEIAIIPSNTAIAVLDGYSARSQ